MFDHAVVGVVAAVLTAVLVLPVRAFGRRVGALRWRTGEGPDTHPRSGMVPVLGGLAMFGGLLGALAVAAPREAFDELFASTSEPFALIAGATIIMLVGVLDDLLDLSAALKLAGQIAAATIVAALGIQLQYFWLPGVGVLALSADLGLVLTVLFLVAFINAVNLVDGLDGLAAGVSGIGALAFLLYALRGGGAAMDLLSSATLVAAITVGVSVGFLVHNWYPARIFMGDTGSMLLGMLLGAAGVAHVGRSSSPTSLEFAASVPLVVPLIVLAVPVLDTALTIVRRLRRDQPISRADLGHLHHALITSGHPHRRAVLVLYGWSAAAGFAVVGPLYLPGATVAGILLVLVLVVLGFTLLGLQGDGAGAGAEDGTGSGDGAGAEDGDGDRAAAGQAGPGGSGASDVPSGDAQVGRGTA